MKKVILALVVIATALCGCSKDIPTGPHTGHVGEYPILFGYSDTRAVADLDSLKNHGFEVYAYIQGNAGSTSFAKDVVYNADNRVWAFESPEYWIPGVSYWFKAFYPQELTSGALSVVTPMTSDLHFKITNFDAINHQEDVMVASATATVPIGASHPENSSVVDLNFQHLLACIDIQMKSAISNITITSVTLVNADTNGTYDSSVNGGTWTAAATGNITFEPNVALNSSTTTSVTNGGFLVIPGNASGKALSIVTNTGNTYNVDLPGMTWAKGNKYTYTAEIKQNNIVFSDPEVDEWDSENATGSVIIK